MTVAVKEKRLTVAGLVVAVIGGIWFGMSLGTEVFQGATKMLGIFLGAGVVLCGLIVAFVYLFRWRKIVGLTSGGRLLESWTDGASSVFLGADSAYVDNDLHYWTGAGARLEAVALVEADAGGSAGARLDITYANTVQRRDLVTGRRRSEWETRTVSIPVPAHRLPQAREVARKLQDRIDGIVVIEPAHDTVGT